MTDTGTLTRKSLASIIDHTNLKANATAGDIEILCREALENGFGMVAVNSSQVERCKKLLAGSRVHVGAAVGFPLGQTQVGVKLYEIQSDIFDGADEIDYVINISYLKDRQLDMLEYEMNQITSLCHRHGVICKAILEICYLTNEEIAAASRIALIEKPDFIKTSTGFGSSGATVGGVSLMKSVVGDEVRIKAAGGIRSWKQCKQLIEAGADRIGTSSSLKILSEFEESR